MKQFSRVIIFVLNFTTINAQSFEWVQNVGSINNEYGRSIAVDHLENVYTTGEFSGTVDFDPGAGVTNLTVIGGRDFYISKLNYHENLSGREFEIELPKTSGIYILVIDAEGNRITHKVIKN